MLSGRYRFVKKLGEGVFGCTYLAFDRKLSKYWAIKEWKECGDEWAENQFWEELRVLKDLDSACFPRIVEAFREEGRCLLVMDWIKGRTLEEILREDGAFAWREAVSCTLGLCRALSLLHGQEPPLLHLDLKPANIMVTAEGTRLIDFGSAMREGEEGMLTGTPGYASPEQLRAESVDVRSDIYSLGAVCRTMLTGRAGGGKAWWKTGKERIPRRLKRAVEKALREDREERFGSVGELERALSPLIKKRKLHPFLAGTLLSFGLLAGITGAGMRMAGTGTQESRGILGQGEAAWDAEKRGFGPEEKETASAAFGPEEQAALDRAGRPVRRQASAVLRGRKGWRKKPERRKLRGCQMEKGRV